MNNLKKYGVFAIVAILFISGLFITLSSFISTDGCVPITEDMTIKKAKEIEEVCRKDVEDLQSQHDALSREQELIKAKADEKRRLLNESPINVDVKKKVNNEQPKAIVKYIHQHVNPIPNVGGKTPKERFENLVNHYGKVTPDVFVEVGREYGVAEELLACIAYAESHIGTHLKAKNNIMNYGNNDRGAKVPYDTIKNNVRAAAHGLKHGTYLSKNKLLGELSNGGRVALGLPTCENKGVYCYATSGVNWRGNVNDCMTFIHDENKDWDNYLF